MQLADIAALIGPARFAPANYFGFFADAMDVVLYDSDQDAVEYYA